MQIGAFGLAGPRPRHVRLSNDFVALETSGVLLDVIVR